jgi:hypothetical protein
MRYNKDVVAGATGIIKRLMIARSEYECGDELGFLAQLDQAKRDIDSLVDLARGKVFDYYVIAGGDDTFKAMTGPAMEAAVEQIKRRGVRTVVVYGPGFVVPESIWRKL